MGKTRVTMEAAAQLRREGLRVLVGCCPPLGADGPPYAAISMALARTLPLASPVLAALTGQAELDRGRLLHVLATTVTQLAGADDPFPGLGERSGQRGTQRAGALNPDRKDLTVAFLSALSWGSCVLDATPANLERHNAVERLASSTPSRSGAHTRLNQARHAGRSTYGMIGTTGKQV